MSRREMAQVKRLEELKLDRLLGAGASTGVCWFMALKITTCD